jgi:hypothetical protein
VWTSGEEVGNGVGKEGEYGQKSVETALAKGGGEWGRGMEGMNLTKVHYKYMEIWQWTPTLYN